MMRAISIVLIVTIALQVVGCSAWRPLARMNEAPEDARQASMRNQVLGKLKEGMVVRIEILEGTYVPIKGQIIECVIEKVGLTSLTLTPFKGYARRNDGTEFTLRYTDIVSIQYRQVGDSTILVGGVVVGAVLGFFGIAIIAFNEQE